MNYARPAPLVRSGFKSLSDDASRTWIYRDRLRQSRSRARGSAIEISSIYVNYGLEVNIYKINCVPTHHRRARSGLRKVEWR